MVTRSADLESSKNNNGRYIHASVSGDRLQVRRVRNQRNNGHLFISEWETSPPNGWVSVLNRSNASRGLWKLATDNGVQCWLAQRRNFPAFNRCSTRSFAIRSSGSCLYDPQRFLVSLLFSALSNRSRRNDTNATDETCPWYLQWTRRASGKEQ